MKTKVIHIGYQKAHIWQRELKAGKLETWSPLKDLFPAIPFLSIAQILKHGAADQGM